MGEPHHRGDEHVEHRLLGVDVVVEEAPLEAEPRVVDQQVDRAAAVGQPRLHARELSPVREVGREHLDLHAVRRAQLLGDPLLEPPPELLNGIGDVVISAAGEEAGDG